MNPINPVKLIIFGIADLVNIIEKELAIIKRMR
jgi:hypothetical protein